MSRSSQRPGRSLGMVKLAGAVDLAGQAEKSKGLEDPMAQLRLLLARLRTREGGEPRA
jgi:hypothetical protein